MSNELKNLGLYFFEPHEQLKSFIQCYWVIQAKKEVTHKIITDGGMGIVFNFGSSFLMPSLVKENIKEKRYILTGPELESFDLQLDKGIYAVGIRFNPGGAYPFLKNIAFQKLNYIIELNEQHFSNIQTLYETLKSSKQKDKIQIILDNYFLQLLNNMNVKPDYWIHNVINRMEKSNNTMNIEELADEFNLSTRHFKRRFKKEVGLSPKQFLRILRIKDARKLMNTQGYNSLTDVGYKCNYFDQSHFIRDFKFFVDETPKEYIKRKKQMSHFYNS